MRRAFGIFLGICAWPTMFLLVLTSVVYNTIFNPSFYTENLVNQIYTPVSKSIYSTLNDEFSEIDSYILESEFDEILRKNLTNELFLDFAQEVSGSFRNLELDLREGFEGLEVDLSDLKVSLASFAQEISELILQKLPLCSEGQLNSCISSEIPRSFQARQISNRIKYSIDRDFPNSFVLLQFDPVPEENIVFDEISFKSLFFVLFVWCLFFLISSVLVLMRSRPFLFSYLGFLFFFFTFGLILIYVSFTNLVTTSWNLETISVISSVLLTEVLSYYFVYIVYSFLITLAFIISAAYLYKEGRKISKSVKNVS